MEPLKYIVGIDVETTALDPASGEIIDVAAIRYDWQTGEEVERFEQLCRPRQSISAEIVALTGITNEMVAKQPAFADMVSRLQEFIGADILLAHNAEFDVRWLSYHGLKLEKNKVFDSYLLATVAYPEAPSYNLGMLSAQLGLSISREHRAAADVELTQQLLRALHPKLVVPPEALNDVEQLLRSSGAEHYRPLFQSRPVATPPVPTAAARQGGEGHLPSLNDIFAEGGVLQQQLAGFSPRQGQLQMAEKVQETCTQRKVALIEAGTGTGKTYAYLVPACRAALAGIPVVISTYTKHLQDQLVEHDIPTILRALNISLQVAVVKGRSNYLCDARLHQLIRRRTKEGASATFSLTEAFLIIKIICWLAGGGSGDLEKLNLSHQGGRILRLIHADSLVCRTQCKQSTTCPYTLTKRLQVGAQISVVNHALLCQLTFHQSPLVAKAFLVIDEAHHIEAAARKATELDLSLEHVQEVAESFMTLAQEGSSTLADHIAAESEQLVTQYTQWLLAAAQLVGVSTRSSELALTSPVRQGSAWQKLSQEAAQWRGRLKFIIGLMRSLEQHSSSEVQVLARDSIRAAERLGLEFENFVEGSSERIQWINTYEPKPGVLKTYLHDVALSVRAVFEQLLSISSGVTITSATLTTRGSFAYIKSRLGLEEVDELIVPTPFNYRENMLIYLVDDGPKPSDQIYEKYLYKALLSLSELLHGRLLALFTSQVAVKKMYQMLIRHLYKANIKVYAQKMTGGRHNMLDKFRRNPDSILLGTLSFWEGIDIPGESLSCVVIPKLSFPSPDDPQLSAIAASENLNAFADLFVPAMILRLRQGVGRLLRSATDRGVVVILDPRLHRHQYGDEVLKSLPPATIHIGSGKDLLPKVREWFGDEVLKNWQTITNS